MRVMTPVPVSGTPILATLRRGFRCKWQTVLLLAAISTGIATILWVDDTRPFWQPLLTAQLYGFAIAYCVNAVSPWEKSRPVLRLVAAVAVGTLLGGTLTILVKGYSSDYIASHASLFGWTIFAGFTNGLFVSLFFYVKHRETRAAAALHKAEAERHLLSKQTIEAELKLMQAQVEPHFLFNTLASVQYLTETDPREASRLLGHLIDYLRAALPQLRASSTTLGKEVGLAEAYLNILQHAHGLAARLRDRRLAGARRASVPAEPAHLAGRECDQARRRTGRRRRHRMRAGAARRRRAGGHRARHRPRPERGRARRSRRGSFQPARAARRALRHAGQFTLEDITPCGTCATLSIPYAAEADEGAPAAGHRFAASTAHVSPH